MRASIPEIPRAKRRKKELSLYLDSFFTKRLTLGSDQPSASSGEIARSVASSVLSVSSECGDFVFPFVLRCTTLVLKIVVIFCCLLMLYLKTY